MEVRNATEGVGAGVRSAAGGTCAELRTPDKEDLWIFLKIFVGFLLSIAAKFWVYIFGIVVHITAF